MNSVEMVKVILDIFNIMTYNENEICDLRDSYPSPFEKFSISYQTDQIVISDGDCTILNFYRDGVYDCTHIESDLESPGPIYYTLTHDSKKHTIRSKDGSVVTLSSVKCEDDVFNLLLKYDTHVIDYVRFVMSTRHLIDDFGEYSFYFAYSRLHSVMEFLDILKKMGYK